MSLARRTVAVAFFLAILCAVARAEESQVTKDAFQRYVTSAEKRIDAQNTSKSGFLWIDQNEQRRDAVHKGGVQLQRIDTPEIPGGTLEHWIGGEFLPGATLTDVIKADQNYAKYPIWYAPEILEARVLSHDGNHFRVFYRMKKHEIITVVLDTVHDVEFIPLGTDRYFVRSRSADIREVSHYGEHDEKDLPVDQGTGFLWAINSYWRLQQRDGGVYLECEVITLGRSIPFGMGGLVHSVIESLARESLTNTLAAKRRAALQSR